MNITFDDIVFKDEWILETSQGFGHRIGIIPGMLLYTAITGRITQDGIDKALVIWEKVYREGGFFGKKYILIVDCCNMVDSTFGAKTAYAKGSRQLNRKYDCEPTRSYVIGASLSIRISMKVFSGFLSHQFIFVDSMDEALASISSDKPVNSPSRQKEIIIRQEHIDEFSAILGGVIWPDSKHFVEPSFSKDNPLSEIKATLSYIKQELVELKKKEQAVQSRLREREQSFQSFFSTITDIVLIAGTDGSILFNNRAAEQKLGYDSDTLKTMHLADLRPKNRVDEFETNIEAALRGDEPLCLIPLKSDSGAIIPVETRLLSGLWHGEACVYSISKDLTREQEERERFELLFKKNPSPMVLSNIENGGIVDINDAYTKTFGSTKSDVLGKGPDDLRVFVDDKQKEYILNGIVNGKNFKGVNLRVRTATGEIREVLYSGEPIFAQSSGYYLGVVNDITEQVRTEKKLRAERERFINIVEATNIGIWEMDVQKNIMLINERWAEIIGYTVEELMPIGFDKVASLLHPDDMLKTKQSLEAHFAGEIPIFERESRMRHKKGHWVWVHATGRVLTRTDDGTPLVMYGIHSDITHKKETEERLRLIQKAVDASSDALLVTKTNGEIFFQNDTHRRVFGYSDEELRHLSPRAVFMDTEIADEVISKTMKTGSFNDEAEVITRSGRRFPVHIRANTVLNDAGERIAVVSSARDITERKHAEETLRQNQKRTETILQAVQSGVLVIDASTQKIREVNPAAAAMIGAPQDEIMGQSCRSYLCEGVGEDCCPINDDQNALDREESTLLRKDGSHLTIVKTTKQIDLLGEKYLLVTFFDISDRIEQERQVKEMAARAEKASAAKSEFLANMSHEIRTPMNGVVGMIELLLTTQLTSEQRQYIDTARTSADALLSLINDILDFSKIEAGRLELSTLDFNLDQFLSHLEKMMRYRIEKKGLEFSISVDKNVPKQLSGDPNRLRQILVNLIGNALKFTEEGSIRVSVSAPAENEKNVQLRFDVVDTGIGIPDDKLGILFDKFTQVDGTTVKKYAGTGLGLAISKRIVSLMGGEIGVTSVEGKGSTFQFTVRLDKQDPSSQDAKLTDTMIDFSHMTPPISQSPAAIASPKTEDLPKQGTAQILLAEDNFTNQRVAKSFLKILGLSCDIVVNGREAVNALQKKRYDLVLMDVSMPEMDGLEATRVIRSLDKSIANRDVPILALTAHAIQGDKEESLDAGMNDYVTKPLTLDKLKKSIKKWLPLKTTKPDPKKETEAEPTSDHLSLASQNAKQEQPPVFDESELSERFAENDHIIPVVLEGFLMDQPEQLDRMTKYVKERDAKKAGAQAHKIKGAAAAVCGESFREMAYRMERAGADGDIGVLDADLPELLCRFEELKNAIIKSPFLGHKERQQ